MKKLMAIALSAVMVLSMAACGSKEAETTAAPQTTAAAAETTAAAQQEAEETTAASADGCPTLTTTDPITIIWSHNAPEAAAGHQAALKFKEEIETRSNGVVTVKIYPNGELGTVPENDQALREGTIQIMSGASGGLASLTLAYFDLPCLVSSAEEFDAMFGRGTELRAYTEKVYNDMGMQVLSFVPGAFATISSNVEINKFEDMAGLNIRTPENEVAMTMFKNWGCNPTPVGFSELYIALQQGLVDAQFNTMDTIVSSRLHEVQKYLIKTYHSVGANGIYMNLDFYNGLPEDVKALINWVCENIVDDYTCELVNEAEVVAEETMKEAGLTFVEFTADDIAKMREAAQPVYDMTAELCGQEVIDLIAAAQAE